MRLLLVSPGDRVRVVDGRLVTNDAPVAGFSEEFLMRLAASMPNEVVPEGHYYVLGERRENANITEYRGLHPASRLARVE